MIEFRFFYRKPKNTFAMPDREDQFETLTQAKIYWMDSDYDVMHMMERDKHGGEYPMSYVKTPQ